MADQILEHVSLGIAPVMGPLGSVPAIDVGYPDGLCRDPDRRAEFGGLCHTRDAAYVYFSMLRP